jgi:hypothetical protein
MHERAPARTASHVEPRLLVALYGSSLMLAGLARRLEREGGLEVVPVEGRTVGDALGTIRPDALIVDLNTVPIESAVALLHDRPDLFLVGLEASGARLLVLSGNHARAVRGDDLVALMSRAGGSENGPQ